MTKFEVAARTKDVFPAPRLHCKPHLRSVAGGVFSWTCELLRSSVTTGATSRMPHPLREPESLDFSLSPLPIPARFHHVRYDGARYPGAAGVVGLDGGANCQQFAYELIR